MILEGKNENIDSEEQIIFKLKDYGLGDGIYIIMEQSVFYPLEYQPYKEIKGSLADLILALYERSKELNDQERKDIRKYVGILNLYKERFISKLRGENQEAYVMLYYDAEKGTFDTYKVNLWLDKKGEWLLELYGRVEGVGCLYSSYEEKIPMAKKHAIIKKFKEICDDKIIIADDVEEFNIAEINGFTTDREILSI